MQNAEARKAGAGVSPFRIAVGSTNPVKLESVREAAAQIFENEAIEVIAVAAESGVSVQPMGDAETMAGASQRAREALTKLPGADIGIGIEGGVDVIDGRLYTFSWCVAINTESRIQCTSTERWELPAPVAVLIRDGLELGDAIDRVYGRDNAKQQEGAVGIVTRGRLTRARAQAPAVLLALAGLLWGE